MTKSAATAKRVARFKVQFPHISRFITAPPLRRAAILTGKAVFGVVCTDLLLINTYLTAPRLFTRAPILASLLKAQVAISRTPLKLFSEKATGGSTGANVLGATHASDPNERAVALRQSQYRYWTEVSKEHPDYRDAHVMLAVIGYELNKPEDVKIHVDAVARLDPLYPRLPELRRLIGKE